jgi:glycosyltransferase involved in cell wall biosynthesis
VRVAIYSDFAYRREGGQLFAEEAFVLFMARLADFCDRVVLLGRLDPAPGKWHHRIRDDVDFVALPYYASLSGPLSIASWPRSLRSFWRVLEEVDAVWLLGPHPLAVAFAALALARRRRVVLGVRQNMPEYARRRHPRRPLLWLAALMLEGIWHALARVCPVVVVGPDLAHRYRRARSAICLFVSLVDEQDIVTAEEALSRPYDGELTLLSVGRLDPEKNPLLLADVLAIVRERDTRWRLVVCGDGVLRRQLEERLESLGLSSHAELRGYVPLDAGLRSLYRGSHALLHVSWTEGAPQVLLEAFAAGLPVVATAVGGVRELAGEAARLVPPGDPDPPAREVLRIATDAVERKRLIEAGLEQARAHLAAHACGLVADLLGRTPGEQPREGA